MPTMPLESSSATLAPVNGSDAEGVLTTRSPTTFVVFGVFVLVGVFVTFSPSTSEQKLFAAVGVQSGFVG